ncbi:MAG: type II secretion system F family protein [Firmicutes bacterium]|jgi:tight adherence protein C|nr:type II secretion system F family protein [Bacillota bacterium]
MLALLLTAIGLSVGLAAYLAALAVYEPKERVEERLGRVFGERAVVAAAPAVPDEPLLQRAVLPLLTEMSRWLIRVTPVGWRNSLRRKLTLAGNPGGLETGQFLALYLVVIIAAACGGFLFAEAIGQPLFALVSFGFGLLLPDFWLKGRIQARQGAMQKSLPSFLDLLTVSVEAGLGFDAALARVTARESGPLAEEFQRVLQEIRMGKPRRDALRDLGNRTEVKELSGFVAAIVQADQLGVSIGNVLRVQAQQMRRSRRQRAEEAAMKAPIKMLFPLVFFIFPSLFIILLGPAVIQLIEAFTSL